MSPPSVSELGGCREVAERRMSPPSVAELGGYSQVAERSMSPLFVSELGGCREVAERSMSPPSGTRTLRVPCGRGAPNVATTRAPKQCGCRAVARSVSPLRGPQLCGCRAVAGRPMSPHHAGPNSVGAVGRRALGVATTRAQTVRVPCGRGTLDVATTGGTNLAGAVRSRSARRRHHTGPDGAGAVWSRNARRRRHERNELGGCREVAERSTSPQTVRAPWGRGALDVATTRAQTVRVSCGRGALGVFTTRNRTLRVPCGRGALDVATTGGTNFVGAVRSRSVPTSPPCEPGQCRAVAGHSVSSPPTPNIAGAVWSRSARCLHRLGPELWRVPCGR